MRDIGCMAFSNALAHTQKHVQSRSSCGCSLSKKLSKITKLKILHHVEGRICFNVNVEYSDCPVTVQSLHGFDFGVEALTRQQIVALHTNELYRDERAM